MNQPLTAMEEEQHLLKKKSPRSNSTNARSVPYLPLPDFSIFERNYPQNNSPPLRNKPPEISEESKCYIRGSGQEKPKRRRQRSSSSPRKVLPQQDEISALIEMQAQVFSHHPQNQEDTALPPLILDINRLCAPREENKIPHRVIKVRSKRNFKKLTNETSFHPHTSPLEKQISERNNKSDYSRFIENLSPRQNHAYKEEPPSQNSQIRRAASYEAPPPFHNNTSYKKYKGKERKSKEENKPTTGKHHFSLKSFRETTVTCAKGFLPKGAIELNSSVPTPIQNVREEFKKGKFGIP